MSGIRQTKVHPPASRTTASGLDPRCWPELAIADVPRPGLLLRDTVAQRIVPHLLHLHPPHMPETAVMPDDIAALARHAAKGDPARVLARLEYLLDSGTTADALCLEVLAPAARHLGTMWEQDEYSFTEVTIGVARLHEALRRLSPTPQVPRIGVNRPPSILMVPVPGEQHHFGLAMAAGFFQRAGWAVTSGLFPQLDTLQTIVRTRHFDVVGFSASAERHVEMLARGLRAVRQHSVNPRVLTMVGGPLFLSNPGLPLQLGADSVATDGAQAPAQAAHLLLDQGDPPRAARARVGPPPNRMAQGEPDHRERRAAPSTAGHRAPQPRSRDRQAHRAGGG